MTQYTNMYSVCWVWCPSDVETVHVVESLVLYEQLTGALWEGVDRQNSVDSMYDTRPVVSCIWQQPTGSTMVVSLAGRTRRLSRCIRQTGMHNGSVDSWLDQRLRAGKMTIALMAARTRWTAGTRKRWLTPVVPMTVRTQGSPTGWYDCWLGPMISVLTRRMPSRSDDYQKDHRNVLLPV